IRDFPVTGVQTCALPILALGAVSLAAGVVVSWAVTPEEADHTTPYVPPTTTLAAPTTTPSAPPSTTLAPAPPPTSEARVERKPQIGRTTRREGAYIPEHH